ncbi:MAG: DCC1-like thiol-disulfide oxidoreductase family protein [Pseudomonadota bacterium]
MPMISPQTQSEKPGVDRPDNATNIVVIFDTDCVLCSGFVHFILRHERDNDIVFVNAWSETGLALAARHGLTKDDLNETYLVIAQDRGVTKSAAVLVILQHLKAPWRWLHVFGLLPAPLLDRLYSIVARRRYRWFGFKEQCFLPAPDSRHRYIDA